jgi:hypothetical protein
MTALDTDQQIDKLQQAMRLAEQAAASGRDRGWPEKSECRTTSACTPDWLQRASPVSAGG